MQQIYLYISDFPKNPDRNLQNHFRPVTLWNGTVQVRTLCINSIWIQVSENQISGSCALAVSTALLHTNLNYWIPLYTLRPLLGTTYPWKCMGHSHLWNDNALMDPMVVKQSSFIPKKPRWPLRTQQQKGRKFGRNCPIIKGECQPPSGPQIRERGSTTTAAGHPSNGQHAHCKKFCWNFSAVCLWIDFWTIKG